MGAERFFSEHPWETGRTGPRADASRTTTATPKPSGDDQFAQQVSKASLSVSAAAGGPWVFE